MLDVLKYEPKPRASKQRPGFRDTESAGDQAFHQVAVFSGHAAELRLTYVAEISTRRRGRFRFGDRRLSPDRQRLDSQKSE